jgi:hypothetical protein
MKTLGRSPAGSIVWQCPDRSSITTRRGRRPSLLLFSPPGVAQYCILPYRRIVICNLPELTHAV